MNTKKLLDDLGREFERRLEELSVEKAIEGYERMRRMEWERVSTIQAIERCL